MPLIIPSFFPFQLLKQFCAKLFSLFPSSISFFKWAKKRIKIHYIYQYSWKKRVNIKRLKTWGKFLYLSADEYLLIIFAKEEKYIVSELKLPSGKHWLSRHWLLLTTRSEAKCADFKYLAIIDHQSIGIFAFPLSSSVLRCFSLFIFQVEINK